MSDQLKSDYSKENRHPKELYSSNNLKWEIQYKVKIKFTKVEKDSWRDGRASLY